MKLKELFAKAQKGETLAPEESAVIESCDPEALTAELTATRRRLEESEAEFSHLKHEHQDLLRRHRIAELAAEQGFTDPDYLDYLTRRSQVALDDPGAVAAFCAGLREQLPHCFVAKVVPGGAGGGGAASHPLPEPGTADPLDELASRIGAAPDCR